MAKKRTPRKRAASARPTKPARPTKRVRPTKPRPTKSARARKAISPTSAIVSPTRGGGSGISTGPIVTGPNIPMALDPIGNFFDTTRVGKAVVRPGDLLALRIELHNLAVEAGARPRFASPRPARRTSSFISPRRRSRRGRSSRVPPKSSQLQCEQHGLFDSLFSNPADIKTAYAIAAREAGTLYDAGPSTQIELVTPGSLANVATTASVPPELPTSENPTGDRLVPGQYVVHREALIETPYLPDGASGGVALRAAAGHSLPGVTGPVVLGPSAAVVLGPTQELVLVVAHGKSWPDSQGFRIVLQERAATIVDLPCGETFTDTGAPAWDETNRVLTLFVAKGRIVRLRYASFADKNFVHTLGLPDWANTVGEKQLYEIWCRPGAAGSPRPIAPSFWFTPRNSRCASLSSSR